MTNDILEQITEDYLREDGYFTQHNISYRPKNFKQTPSDIDIMAVHPTRKGVDKVVVVSCKSWQSGLSIPALLRDLTDNPTKRIQGKSRIKLFREIADRAWSKAMAEKVYKLTGQKTFTFYITATHIKGDRRAWEEFKMFKKNLPNCGIKLLSMQEMITKIVKQKQDTRMPVYSELGRLLQLIKAASGGVEFKNLKK
jgi:hypothetical protein